MAKVKHKPIIVEGIKVRNPFALDASMRKAPRFQDKRRKLREKANRKEAW